MNDIHLKDRASTHASVLVSSTMNRAETAFKLPADIPERWEASYRHFLCALDRYLSEKEGKANDDLETLRIADLEILSEAMRMIYRAMTGGPADESRFNYLLGTPEVVPAWKKAVRIDRKSVV